jgi:hypothetical protein
MSSHSRSASGRQGTGLHPHITQTTAHSLSACAEAGWIEVEIGRDPRRHDMRDVELVYNHANYPARHETRDFRARLRSAVCGTTCVMSCYDDSRASHKPVNGNRARAVDASSARLLAVAARMDPRARYDMRTVGCRSPPIIIITMAPLIDK